METVNIAITRGTGGFTHVFDLSTFASPIDVLANDQFVWVIVEKTAPRITKASSTVDGGSTDEIDFDDGTNQVTVKLSESEKNGLPDSGYNHILYRNGQMIATGTITVSGSEPTGTPAPTSVPFGNAFNVRENITGNFTFGFFDDYVIANPSAPIEGKFEDYAVCTTKRYIVKNAGSANLRIVDHNSNTVLVVTAGGTAELISNGTGWIIVRTT